MKTHFYELKGGKKRTSNPEAKEMPYSKLSVWQEDYNRFGRSAFSVYVIERDVPQDVADASEQKYILQYRANEPEYGYNIRPTKRINVDYIEGAPPLPFEPCRVDKQDTA